MQHGGHAVEKERRPSVPQQSGQPTICIPVTSGRRENRWIFTAVGGSVAGPVTARQDEPHAVIMTTLTQSMFWVRLFAGAPAATFRAAQKPPGSGGTPQ